MNKISPKLVELIEEYVGELDLANIENVSLYHDLKIYGDDADELLQKYVKKFNVRVCNFQFNNYFPYEGDMTFILLWRLLMRKGKKEYKKITINDLQIGIEMQELKL